MEGNISTAHKHLFCFGLGYVGVALAKKLLSIGWQVSGTVRTSEKAKTLKNLGINAYIFDGALGDTVILDQINASSHLISTIAPTEKGDLVINAYKNPLKETKKSWVGYLSTTGVYGDHKGGWVDENTPPNPEEARSKNRLTAEQQWHSLNLPLHIFRIAGIYGPNRNILDQLKKNTAQNIVKEGQFFSRIHVDDIVKILMASMAQPTPHEIYNIADDAPSSRQDLVNYGAKLLGITPPKPVPFVDADLSPMTKSFYASNRRVSNRKVKEKLNISLDFPTYQEGLSALAKRII